MIHAEVRITLSHLCCPVPQEFSDRMQIQPGHHQFTGEGMAIAMPRIVFYRERSSISMGVIALFSPHQSLPGFVARDLTASGDFNHFVGRNR
jgi:hypothetical protein